MNQSSIAEPKTTSTSSQRVARLLESLPPHAIDMEMCLLGSILLEPGPVLSDIAFIVRDASDFYKPANGQIFKAMAELYNTNASLDVVQLAQRLEDRDVLESVGGQDYLVELVNSVPSATNALHYAKTVREKSVLRRLIEETSQILATAYDTNDEAQKVLDDAEHRIFSIAERYEHSDIETMKQLVKDFVARVQDGGQIQGVHTGFGELDELTGGFQPGDFVIIAARPSMGKTAIALNVAEHMALNGQPVGFFSLEMSRNQLVERLLASRSGLDLHRLRRMMLGKDHYAKLFAACGDLQDAPIYVDDMAGSTLLQIRARARRMSSKYQIKAVFIDYIQLLSTGGRVESRQLEVSEVSRSLKALARELEIPVVCLSQLNRAAESREGHRPRLSDLRESGSLEQDADVVGLLHREDYYHQGDDDYESTNLAELIIAKQRNGPTGSIKLTWVNQSTRFKDYTPATAPEFDAGYDAPPF